MRGRRPVPVLAFTAVLAAFMAMALSACGSSSSSSSTTAASTAATSSTTATAATTTATTATTATGTTTGTSTAKAAGGATKLVVEADPNGQIAFVQKTLSAKAGKITLELKNASPVPHNLAVEGASGVSNTVSDGKTADLTVTLKPGTYTYYCTVPGHRQAGMTGTLTVK